MTVDEKEAKMWHGRSLLYVTFVHGNFLETDQIEKRKLASGSVVEQR